MKQFTSPAVPSGSGTPSRPSGAAPHARISFPVMDFANPSGSSGPSPVEDHPSLAIFGATYQRITDLPPAPAATSDSVFAPHGDPIPAPDPGTGLRRYDSRDYVDMDDGATVRVTRDPVTGEWHERPSDRRVARGPALHRDAQTNTWRSGSPPSSSTSSLRHSGVSLSTASRIDPVWDLGLYRLPVAPAFVGGAVPAGLKPLMIGNERYYMDVHFGDRSGSAPHATADIYSVNPAGKRTKAGRVEPDGLYRLKDGRHYLSVDTGFCPVTFDSANQRWKVTAPPGATRPDILIEMGGAPDKWVPMLAVADVVDLFQSARRLRGYPGLVGAIDWVGSSIDKRVYSYMQGYLRQIIGFCDPHISDAPVASKGGLIDAYIWKYGYPYDCLAAIHHAVENVRPIPPGMPVFDAFQGLGMARCSKDGNFAIARIYGQLQLIYPARPRSAAEDVLLAEWQASSAANDNRKKGECNEKMYEARLMEDGYTLLPGGTYGNGQNGFDRVFEGPAGQIYVLEAKHVSYSPSGGLGNVSLAGMTHARQMTDNWVREVLNLCNGNTDAAKKVGAALAQGQLFKLLGATTQDGKLIMFKIDMSPVEF